MKISEDKQQRKQISFADASPGSVYRDGDGQYVIADDEDGTVRLADGFRWCPLGDEKFTPVDATLVINP